jgi:hypothetical protein
MTTTLGQLIADLYDVFEERAHDPELAVLATAAVVNDMLCQTARRGRPARSRAQGGELTVQSLI